MKIKTSKLIKILLFTKISFLLFTLPVYAQIPSEQTDLTKLSLEELMDIEIDTVYTASKYEQRVTEAPSSISIVTADDIRKFGYRDLGEIFRSIRGFHVTYDRNYRYLGVRGFGLPSDYNNRILLLIDGIRHNEIIYDSSAVSNEFPVNIDNIARIEIVRGPSSSLYGNSAFFAVVNIITKRGEDLNGSEVSADAGSFETYKGRLTYGNKFDNGLELYVSGSYLESEGDDLFFEEFDDPSTNNGIAEGRDYSRFKKVFIKTTYEDFTLEGFYSDSKKGVPTAPWETLFNGDTFTVDEYYVIDLKYDHTYDNELNVLARVNYNKYHYYGIYPFEGDPSIGEEPIVKNDDSATAEWIYGEVHATRRLFEKHKVTVGAAFSHNYKQDQKTFYKGASDWGFLDDKRHSNNWALFLQDEFTITDKLILNAGIRYDDFESFGDTTNPRAALIYSPSEKTALKAIYGSAFRAPSVYELYYHDDGGTQRQSTDLEPETIETYELVYEQYLGEHLQGTIVGFYYDIEELIAQTTDPDDICDFGEPCIIFENLNEVEAAGVELELSGKWENGYAGRISYTYQETENKETDKILSNSPRHLAKANLSIPIFREKVFLNIEEQYTGRRKTIRSNEVDDYFVTNVTLFSQNIIDGLEASASVYNLFDEKYYDPGAEEHTMDKIEQDGITYRFKLTYKF